MNKELFVPLPSTPSLGGAPAQAASQAARLATKWLRAAGIVAGGSALAAVCAHVAVPLFFTPVPLSLQPFAVLLLGLLLTPRMAAATFAAYLLEGAAGLPVFAAIPGSAGVAHLLGPTGGYLLAYPLAAALISFLYRRFGRGFTMALVSAAAGDAAILVCGALWLAIFTQGVGFTHGVGVAHGAGLTQGAAWHAAALAVLPFLPGDALKIAAAAAMAAGALGFARRSASSGTDSQP